MLTVAVQVLDVDFDSSDEEMPLSEPNSKEELEEMICEEITSETGLMVRSFDYLEIITS